MPISSDHAGRTYPATGPYDVTAGKIEEFATAVGYSGTNDAGGAVVAPPTFAAVIAAQAWEQLFSDPELELALRRIVHADQRFTFTDVLRAGDQVQATLTLDQVRVRGGSEMISSTVRIDRVGPSESASVCTVQATFLHSRQDAA